MGSNPYRRLEEWRDQIAAERDSWRTACNKANSTIAAMQLRIAALEEERAAFKEIAKETQAEYNGYKRAADALLVKVGEALKA